MANATLTPLPLAALGPWCPPPYSARLNATAGGSYDPDGGLRVGGRVHGAGRGWRARVALPAAFNRDLTAPFDAAPAFFPVDAAGLGAEVEVCGPLSRGRYNFTLSVVDEQGGVSATALVGSLLIGADGYPTGLLPALPPNASAPDAEPECGASTTRTLRIEGFDDSGKGFTFIGAPSFALLDALQMSLSSRTAAAGCAPVTCASPALSAVVDASSGAALWAAVASGGGGASSGGRRLAAAPAAAPAHRARRLAGAFPSAIALFLRRARRG